MLWGVGTSKKPAGERPKDSLQELLVTQKIKWKIKQSLKENEQFKGGNSSRRSWRKGHGVWTPIK
ncbi:AIF_HP2_G0052190.mRNA.1.CDS.1 [Saccharomyces cerevisiae]|nr:AIF_HP2_G0052190.mRNA.1.CDS.1 [Saccharomyces cerevisiae]CAI6796487.1 AIF_HP2_G0052190.mRNA.1.CDS.1 [Saccharomyces cerevisiae]